MTEWVTIGRARLVCGDCRDILPTLGKVDAVVTDPPYGIGITKSNRLAVSRGMGGGTWDDETPPAELIEAIVTMAPEAIIWGGNYFGLPSTRCVLVWDKQNDDRDFADLEMAWTNIDAVARIFRMRPMNMDGGKVHPTQKPVRLMKWCIEKLADPTVIFDPFCGSGSTGVAAVQMGRDFIGIEREPKYFDIACRRIEEAQRQGDLFIEGAAA
ncbi:site-specific DNA-methyltransferase [Pseudanabaena phage Pan3]|nr:site-specific DNA-methyltransferase [Pseudanabaena phage Pan3]